MKHQAKLYEWQSVQIGMLRQLRTADSVLIGTYRLTFWDRSEFLRSLAQCPGKVDIIVGYLPSYLAEVREEVAELSKHLPKLGAVSIRARFHSKYIYLRDEDGKETVYFGSANFGDSVSKNIVCVSTRAMDVEFIKRYHRDIKDFKVTTASVRKALALT